MSWHLFSYLVMLLLFVLLTCCGIEAAGSAPGMDINSLTGTTPITGAKWEEMQCAEGSVRSLRVPSLVEVDGAVFAVAEAHCKNGSGSFTGILSQHLKGIGTEPTEIPMGAGTGSFHTQLLKEGGNEMRDTVRPTTIVNDNNVYVLLGSCSRATLESKEADRSECKIMLVKGSVTDGGEKKVQWGEPHAADFEARIRATPGTYVSAGGGSATVMSDGTLVFPLQATRNRNTFLMVAHFTPSENRWEPVVDMVDEGCSDPSIVEWDDVYERRIFMMAPCTNGSYYMYKSLSLYYWPTGEPISRLWGISGDRKREGVRSSFITATINGKKVMLLTTPVYSEEKGEDRLHLWMTDNARVHDVGPVSREGDDAAASSLLYRSGKKELILLYENKKSGDSYSLVAVNLTEQLKQIKSVVKAWKDMDTALKNCASTGTVDPRIKNVCKSAVPTKGLIGFWSNSLEGSLWKDEYFGVNAMAHGGNVAGTEGGVRFRGAAAGAEWPVGSKGQFQPYHFVNNDFTLVATVMINVVPEADSPVPLMGVRMNDDASTVIVGLFYTKDKKWGVTVNGKYWELSNRGGTWQPGTTYQVALKRHWNELYVYVDNNELVQERVPVSEYTSRGVLDFYVGGDGAKGTDEVDVTVGNVLLYNEALYDDGLTSLSASKVTLPTPAADGPLTTLGNDGEIASKLKSGEKRVGDGLSPKGPLPEEAHKGSHSAGEESGSLLASSSPASSSPASSSPASSSPASSSPASSSPASSSPASSSPASSSPTSSSPTSASPTSASPTSASPTSASPASSSPVSSSPKVRLADGPDDGSMADGGSENTSAVLAKDTPSISLSGDSSVAFDNLTRVRPDSGSGDGTMRGCASRLLLLLLGLWGFAALC
ncbi:trans-sialidase [Trypanosoma rangeli]|uniref:Trans-sialidase n=1 Tax=Trypanosoma rangeli TaxID=5698 RepID=A0A3R7M0K5_TRYRA|nr:trans-sialidase [Trypanosoma rangeli]RNE97184.1 trans-sialidase [Trypanosoma rangeli]|eukprot:RNE97184.1 trans-sialidase [Trypanosoma rangeli]